MLSSAVCKHCDALF